MGHLVNLLWTCSSYIQSSWNSWPEFLWIVRRGQKKKWWKHVLSVKLGAVYFNRPGRVMERKLLAMFARLGFTGKTKQNCSPAIFTSIKRIGPLYWKSSKSLIETADTDASIANGDCKSSPSPRSLCSHFHGPLNLLLSPSSEPPSDIEILQKGNIMVPWAVITHVCPISSQLRILFIVPFPEPPWSRCIETPC